MHMGLGTARRKLTSWTGPSRVAAQRKRLCTVLRGGCFHCAPETCAMKVGPVSPSRQPG